MGKGHLEMNQILFNDGAAYERYMGKWSQLVGEAFLLWLAPKSGLRWLDVGCGNGAFTETIVNRCAPLALSGIDPSEEQLAFARTRPALNKVELKKGDALALPFPDQSFDIAVMPLVLFFVPDPPKGVAEMTRTVASGGSVTAYSWDLPGGGSPYASLQAELEAMGIPIPVPPSKNAVRIEALMELWLGAGLEAVETLAITVERIFSSFDDYWATILGGPSVSGILASMEPKNIEILKRRMRTVLPVAADGTITYSARANAIKGRVAQ
jgi:SAM-dependent methyltransferase